MAQRVDPAELRELAEWRPPLGVVTVCLDVDPSDRRETWRSQLRHGLGKLVEEAHGSERDRWAAMKATAERVLSAFNERPRRHGRSRIGFVEVSAKGGRERWRSFQLPLAETEVVAWERPYLRPLVELLDDGAPLGAIAVASERVRLWEWSLGECEELASWEPEFDKRDWRERRAPRSADPGRSQFTSSAGKDQVGRRLDANRERFLHEAGERLVDPLAGRGWRALLAFGARDQVGAVAAGAGRQAGRPGRDGLLRLVAEKDLAGEDGPAIARRIEELLPDLNRERELELVRMVEGKAHAEGGAASLGRQETLQALAEGRVSHLLFDAGADLDGEIPAPSWGAGGEQRGGPGGAELIEQALRTGAWVTPVEGEAAEALAAHEGVAALLRY